MPGSPLRALVVLSVFSSLLACSGSGRGELIPDEPATPTEPAEVTLTTEDGKLIGGTWQAAMGVERGPGVLLLHQVDAAVGEGHDRQDWDGVFDRLLDSGVSVLAIDFRSHGASDDADVPVFDLGSDRDQLRFDVVAGLDFIDDRGFEVGDGRIGVAGLGLGATMAVVANHYSGEGVAGPWGAERIVAVSARRDRAQDLTIDGDLSLSLSEICYIAAEDNALDAAGAEALYAMTEGDRQLVLVPASEAHGAELLDVVMVVDQLVGWFVEEEASR